MLQGYMNITDIYCLIPTFWLHLFFKFMKSAYTHRADINVSAVIYKTKCETSAAIFLVFSHN